jgi:prophage regulatory protein|tara:strand:+ start:60 stop:248 length:189 start_codon:yes stop_codon:yes gene_type:complete
MNKIISLQQLAILVNKSKVTVWRWWAKDKILPEPIILNGRCLGWQQDVIDQWLLSHTKGCDL